MNVRKNLTRTALTAMALFCLIAAGCDQSDTEEATNEANEAADNMSKGANEMAEKGKEMAGKLGDKAGEMAEKGGEMMKDLGEQAMGFLSPLKEKLGSLESLKNNPAELKTSVSELIASIENKAEGIKLPEGISNALKTIKEKLVALRDYLAGEVEQAEIDKKVTDITESVKSGLGMGGDK